MPKGVKIAYIRIFLKALLQKRESWICQPKANHLNSIGTDYKETCLYVVKGDEEWTNVVQHLTGYNSDIQNEKKKVCLDSWPFRDNE